MHKTVRYADNCLRHFFEIIKTEPWFNKTIFIITGVHSGENFTKPYQSRDGKYEVPILVYDPSNPVRITKNEIVQHIDIIPLALEKAGYSGKIFSMGTYFKPQKLAFQNDEGIYQGINSYISYTFNGSKFYWPTKKLINNEILKLAEFELKAKIQNYNYRMVNNLFY